MKKILSLVLTAALALSLFSGCRFERRNVGDSSASDKSSFSSSSASSSHSSGGEESSKESSVPLPVAEKDDLAVNGCVSSRAPENYGTSAAFEVQSERVSENSTRALKATFNNIGAPVYEGAQIWTWAEFDLEGYFHSPADLREKTFQMDVYTQNCGVASSVILVDSEGRRSQEMAFSNVRPPHTFSVYGEILTGEWRRITLNLKELYGSAAVRDVSSILIMFSNVDCYYDNDSVFYLDNVTFKDAADFPDPTANVKVYNPEGYYSKNESLKIIVAGNSFISTSWSDYWLNVICAINDASAYAMPISIGYGRISDQIVAAFGYDGSQGYMPIDFPDVIFIQDFYGYEDVTNLALFFNALNGFSEETGHRTEVKIYPAENETEDGRQAARLYGVDLVNWKGLIHTLKTESSFNSYHLNYPDDIAHSNEMAGFAGGVLMYMSLYGERPAMPATAQAVFDCMNTDLIPGSTAEEKMSALEDVVDFAAATLGI